MVPHNLNVIFSESVFSLNLYPGLYGVPVKGSMILSNGNAQLHSEAWEEGV